MKPPLVRLASLLLLLPFCALARTATINGGHGFGLGYPDRTSNGWFPVFIRCGSDTPKLASAWSAERDVVWIAWGSIKFAEVLSNAPGLAPGIFTHWLDVNGFLKAGK